MITDNQTSEKKNSKVYFPGLNALRFFAATSVVFSHVEQVKGFWHLPVHESVFLATATGMAVTFFFVLSGFLITYLLFKEKDLYESIDIKKFYLRRILRVWPLYYLIVFLAFAVLPNLSIFHIPGLSDEVRLKLPYNLLFYLALLPNIANIFNMLVVYANQLWSIGVEEQFYLFWPFLIKNTKEYARVFIFIIIVFILSRNVFAFSATHLHNGKLASVCGALNSLLQMTRIDCMAVGGLIALCIYSKQAWFLKYCINRWVEAASLLLIFALSYSGVYIPYVHHDLYAIVFGLFIVNVSCNTKSLFCLEGKLWTKLGNISYGIYMYHVIAIGIILSVFRFLHIKEFSAVTNSVVYILSLLLTVVIAELSYRFFETPFLVFKHKMMRVKSGS